MILGVDWPRFLEFLDRNGWLNVGFLLVAISAFVLFVAVIRPLLRQRLLVAASAALDERTLVRGPFGVVTHVRGTIDGVAVVISRRGVELDGKERVVVLEPRALRKLVRQGAVAGALRGVVARVRAGGLVRGSSANVVCPYCKSDVAPRESEGVIRCPSCDSLHHTPCWQEHGGCSVHGCARVPGDRRERATT